MNKKIISKLKKIKMLLLDVDGVLTDGRIIYDSQGNDLKLFDVHDGMGVHLLGKAGIKTILVTAKGSKTIVPRARDMGVEEVFADVSPKTCVLSAITGKYRVSAEELCFAGDDLVDVCLMKQVGLAVAVANACPEAKAAADMVTKNRGGRGAVRELAELILKTQGKWDEAIRVYVA